MKQPISKKINPNIKGKLSKKVYKPKKTFKKSSKASELDGSGLETYFRKNFLDKLGIKYEQQFEAKDIKRFYDFHLKDSNGNSLMVLIECDGSFFHCDPRIYDKPINTTQKHNIKVDKIKTNWALLHGFCLIRIWEQDIYNNPQKVIKLITEHVNISDKK